MDVARQDPQVPYAPSASEFDITESADSGLWQQGTSYEHEHASDADRRRG